MQENESIVVFKWINFASDSNAQVKKNPNFQGQKDDFFLLKKEPIFQFWHLMRCCRDARGHLQKQKQKQKSNRSPKILKPLSSFRNWKCTTMGKKIEEYTGTCILNPILFGPIS